MRKVPKVTRYIQSHAALAPGGGKSPFLGVAELSFATKEDFDEAMASKEMAVAFADLANFADATNAPAAIVDDVTVI